MEFRSRFQLPKRGVLKDRIRRAMQIYTVEAMHAELCPLPLRETVQPKPPSVLREHQSPKQPSVIGPECVETPFLPPSERLPVRSIGLDTASLH